MWMGLPPALLSASLLACTPLQGSVQTIPFDVLMTYPLDYRPLLPTSPQRKLHFTTTMLSATPPGQAAPLDRLATSSSLQTL